MLLSWFACVIFSMPTSAALPNPEIEHWLMTGIDDLYRMRFKEAENDNHKALELSPDEPRAYLGLAGIAWTQYVFEMDQSDQSLLAPFEHYVREALRSAEGRLRLNSRDAIALASMGGALGLSSRLHVQRHEWLRAYFTGRKAAQSMRAALKIDPDQPDALLGLGMYDYYSDVYPRLVGILAKLVLGGNRLRGIETLEHVARTGRFSRNAAKIVLVEIYTEDNLGSRNSQRAVELARDLRQEFPDSAMMHSLEAVVLYETGRFEEALRVTRDFLSRVQQGKYKPIAGAKGHVALGCILWAMERPSEALDAFDRAARITFDGRPCRWAVWAQIRAGELEDSLGHRDKAIQHYQAAIREPDTWGLRAIARRHLSSPYDRKRPGPISIPD